MCQMFDSEVLNQLGLQYFLLRSNDNFDLHLSVDVNENRICDLTVSLQLLNEKGREEVINIYSGLCISDKVVHHY